MSSNNDDNSLTLLMICEHRLGNDSVRVQYNPSHYAMDSSQRLSWGIKCKYRTATQSPFGRSSVRPVLEMVSGGSQGGLIHSPSCMLGVGLGEEAGDEAKREGQ